MSEETEKRAVQWLQQNRPDIVANWDTMTPGERFQAGRLVPCRIRCARIGGPTSGNPCEECGALETTKARDNYPLHEDTKLTGAFSLLQRWIEMEELMREGLDEKHLDKLIENTKEFLENK